MSTPDDRPPPDLDEIGRRLLEQQTPAHRAQARRIFQRLMDGDDVDDVKDLIKGFADIDRRDRDDPEAGEAHGYRRG